MIRHDYRLRFLTICLCVVILLLDLELRAQSVTKWYANSTGIDGGYDVDISEDSSLLLSTSPSQIVVYSLPTMQWMLSIPVDRYASSHSACFMRHDSEIALLQDNQIIRYRTRDGKSLDTIRYQNFEGIVSIINMRWMYLRYDEVTDRIGLFYIRPVYRQPLPVVCITLDLSGNVVERITSPSQYATSACADNSFVCIPDSNNSMLWKSFSAFDVKNARTLLTSFGASSMASNNRFAVYLNDSCRVALFDYSTNKELWNTRISIPGIISNALTEFCFVNDSIIIVKKGVVVALSAKTGSILWTSALSTDVVIPHSPSNQCFLLQGLTPRYDDCAEFMPSPIYSPESIVVTSIDVTTGKTRTMWPSDYIPVRPSSAEFSSDESLVSVGTSLGTYICNSQSGVIRSIIPDNGLLSPDATELIALHDDSVHVYNTITTKLVRRFKVQLTANRLNTFVRFENGLQLIVVEPDNVTLIDLSDGHKISRHVLSYNGTIQYSALCQNGRDVVIATSALDVIKVNLAKGVSVANANSQVDSLVSVSFSHISATGKIASLTFGLVNRTTKKSVFSGFGVISLDDGAILYKRSTNFGLCNSLLSSDDRYVYLDYRADPILHSNNIDVVQLSTGVVKCSGVESSAPSAESGFPRCSYRIVAPSGRLSLTWMDCKSPITMKELCDSIKTGVDDPPMSDLTSIVYPNPAASILHVHNPWQSIANVEIHNTLGQSIQSTIIDAASLCEISIQALTQGVYTVVLRSEQQMLQQSFLVIR